MAPESLEGIPNVIPCMCNDIHGELLLKQGVIRYTDKGGEVRTGNDSCGKNLESTHPKNDLPGEHIHQ